MGRAELGQLVWIPIEKIVVRKDMIRRDLGDLSDLKSSIKLAGIISPIIVRPLENGMYELVCGRRRLEAEKELGRKEVQAIVRPYDEKMARLVEIEENLRRKDYSSVERAKGLAEYYEIVKEFLGEAKLGRPKALTPEQIKKAKQLREQGKSYSEIAEELGVTSGDTVRLYLKKAETVIQAPSAERTEKIAEKIETKLPISTQASVSVSEKEPELEILPESSAMQAVAEKLGVTRPVVAKAVKTVDAIKRYPALEKLKKSAHVVKLAEIADFWRMSQEQVEFAVKLMLEKGVGPAFAASLTRLTEKEREELLEICKKENVSENVANCAALIIIGSRSVGMTPELAVQCAYMQVCKVFKVPLPRYEVYEALEKAAKDEKVSAEEYIALAALEKLWTDGYLKEEFYKSAAQTIRTKFYKV